VTGAELVQHLVQHRDDFRFGQRHDARKNAQRAFVADEVKGPEKHPARMDEGRFPFV